LRAPPAGAIYTAVVTAESNAEDDVSAPAWRLHLLDGLLRTTAVLMTISLPPLIIQTGSYKRLDWTSLVVITYAIVLAGCFFRRWPYRLRASVLLFGVTAISWLALVRVGYQVGPGVGSAIVVVVAGLLLGRRALVVAYATMIGGFLGMGWLHGNNGGRWVAVESSQVTLFSNWVRTAFSFGLFAGILAIAVMFVVSRVERTLAVRTAALLQLRAEREQRERAQQALAEANQRLVEMQKMEALGRLAGGVAHDFNNALFIVLGWTDLLRAKAMPRDEQLRAFDQIATAASGAARLTQQLLAFGRKAVNVPKSVALAAVVARVRESLASVLPDSVRLVTQLEAGGPPVWADPDQLYQLLLNLCLNARDAMPNGGELSIGVRAVSNVAPHEQRPTKAERWLELTVRDTGLGMDEHTLKNAFEPFFSTKGELGTGLGLSSVYGIVQQSSGQVSVTSELGKGTTFTVLLPQAAHESPVAEQTPLLTPTRRATILVAEDEPSARALIVHTLRGQGHTVVEAENGQQALALARRHRTPFDLLCTDGAMPGIPSRDLVAGFRALFPSAAVLVCSAHIEEQTLRNAIEQHDLYYLAKPFTQERLVDVVHNSLQHGAAS
jgi:signal transduction histidine kinase/ActR/RegA family two-component response regulator